ncbi:MAG TPA: hypothetical protein VFL27_13940 [Candidatus Dormibacteraeota bacterium]|nr:hypothetical protein [Candidatus Dormibacteraeota bacterium]
MVFLHCGQIEVADLRAVHMLARATLGARRAGDQARLAFVRGDLRRLIGFVGLEGALRFAAGFPPRG